MQPDMQDVYRKLDRHAGYIHQLRIDQAAIKAETDTRILHLESGQQEIIKTLAKIEHKIDNTASMVNRAHGGLRLGMWLSGVGIALAGLALTAWHYLRS